MDLGKLYTYFLHCQAINHFTTSDFLGKLLLLLSSSYKRGPYLYSDIDVGVNPFNNKENDLWNKDTDRESLGYVCTHPLMSVGLNVQDLCKENLQSVDLFIYCDRLADIDYWFMKTLDQNEEKNTWHVVAMTTILSF